MGLTGFEPAVMDHSVTGAGRLFKAGTLSFTLAHPFNRALIQLAEQRRLLAADRRQDERVPRAKHGRVQ